MAPGRGHPETHRFRGARGQGKRSAPRQARSPPLARGSPCGCAFTLSAIAAVRVCASAPWSPDTSFKLVSHLCLICVSACDCMRGGGSREARCAAPCKRCQSKCSLMRRAPAIAPTRFSARVHFKHTDPLRLICVSPLQHLAAPLQHPCSTPEGWRATCRGTRSTLFNRCGSTSATVWSV